MAGIALGPHLNPGIATHLDWDAGRTIPLRD